MACADVDMDIHGEELLLRGDQLEPPVERYYQATEIVPDVEGPLHSLLQKQPAVLGAMQVVSGILSVALGILFSVTQDMNESLFTLFRVSQLTGFLFIIAGVASSLLFKYPALLTVSFAVNSGCIAVAVVAACLISFDLAQWDDNDHLKLEALELCVLGFEAVLSAILCFWFTKERHAKTP
ncbi:B-lymphocyte antigen CD20 isoform X2 [Parambassis ranga]|nr:B-lymphocyte antigen CD20-like isoform X2 [Parambassis ranga]XP_028281367.1 B-lymphocyte antigen CD20-like isoform X2 [Parambassis ranga]